MSDYSGIVAKGVQFLTDNLGQEWRKKLDLAKLNVAQCDVCVLGQIFGDYEDGLSQLGIEDSEAKRLGFNTNGDMAALTAAWKEALGTNNTLVELGDVYMDSSECCGVKVVNTVLVTIDGKSVSAYIVSEGSVDNGRFTAYSNGKNLTVRTKGTFEDGGSYSKKLNEKPAFNFKAGQFVTNDTGTAYYVLTDGQYGESRPVKDRAYAVLNDTIGTKGLRILETPAGRSFSAILVK